QDIDANSIIWNFFQRNPLLPVGIGDHDPTDQLLESFYLFHNYPNPFNPSTVIGYRLSVASRVELSIFDLLGKKVRTLVDERQPAGQYEVRWNGEDADGNALSAGIYFYRMKAGEQMAVRKMTYIK
ncbi:MAG: T9SS type A sorting domain-containing protein, partial [Calditrichaeota bacterium]|nr:T9SS type A sorting domain-containing protein [Calditrichota bacterium]